MLTPGQETTRPEQFHAFMLAYQDMVYSTVVRLLGQDGHAQDIAQEVFLKAYENFGQLQDSPTRGGWLKTVATNLSLNHLTRYRRRWSLFSELRHEGSDADDASDDPVVDVEVPDSVLDGLQRDDRAAIVERALAALPDRQRIPLVLYHFEEMPYADIARRLGVSLSKVKIDILRGRGALAQALASQRQALLAEAAS